MQMCTYNDTNSKNNALISMLQGILIILLFRYEKKRSRYISKKL